MVRIYERKAVNQPHSHVWKLLSDLESPLEYHPMVQSVEITSSYRKGIGASRTLYYVDGSVEKEEVVQIGNGSITLHRKVLDQNPEAHYTLTYSVKKLSLTWTEIVIEAFYTLKIGVWQQIKRVFVVGSTELRLQMQFRQELDGIDYHLSTHKRVPKCSFHDTTTTTTTPGAKHSEQKHVNNRHHNTKAVGTIYTSVSSSR